MTAAPLSTTSLSSTIPSLTGLQNHLLQHDQQRDAPGKALTSLVQAGLDRLPLPGSGETWQRWQALAAVAAKDLSLAKLFEGHTDALAITHELGFSSNAGCTWATWCAESPTDRVICSAKGREGRVLVTGSKPWCSGAASVSHALVSCWNEQDEPCLVAIELHQPGIRITGQGWAAVGMADTASVDVIFEHAEGRLVGPPNAYLARPGFWHGGAGIASCWYGGASSIGEITRRKVQAKGAKADAHQLAHLGAMEVALSSTKAVLREVALWIDLHPALDAWRQALRARLSAEACAVEVMHRAGRALGAGPLCKDAHLARLMADLPVFLRQSHAEKDLAALGEELVRLEAEPWAL